ncbi:MAG: class I SAM-dependent methyltransferase [Candidatus Peregrinibacteria bacterium]|nr:class I SAM-dependent methyltransferase [Candidatus Peregrinibacteria bacterium]
MELFTLSLALLIVITVSALATYMIWKLLICNVPLVSSGKRIAKKMIELAELSENQNIYDLGCGTGIILFETEKKFPKNKFTGYEIVRPAIWYSQLKAKLTKSKIQFKCEDFFQADISDADIIFCYLWPSIMDKFHTKKWSELKPGTKIISHGFPISGLDPKQKYQSGRLSIFVYEK